MGRAGVDRHSRNTWRFFFNYLDTGKNVFNPTPATLYNNLTLVIVLFYLFYIGRYMRLRIATAESDILSILSGGENQYHSAFGRLSDPRPVIILTIIISTLEILPTFPLHASFGDALLLQYVVIGLGLACFVWEYSVTNWGLHVLGKSQLKLESFLEDRMMGAKPIGNAALSSTVAYLGGLLFAFLLGTSNPRLNGPGLYGFVAVLSVLGVLMFFLPLNSIHQRMQEEKRTHQRDLGRQLLTIQPLGTAQTGNGPASIEKLDQGISTLVRLKELEITERKLANTPTWPFDIQLLAKLVTIVLSVTAVLLTRLITDYLIHIYQTLDGCLGTVILYAFGARPFCSFPVQGRRWLRRLPECEIVQLVKVERDLALDVHVHLIYTLRHFRVRSASMLSLEQNYQGVPVHTLLR